jgi:TldD protein
MGLDEELAEYAVELAGNKAEYAEVRLHMTSVRGSMLKNGVPEPSTAIESYGLCIRVVHKGALAFGATNRLVKEEVRKLVDDVVKRAKEALTLFKRPVNFSKERVEIAKWRAEERVPIEDASSGWVLERLREVDKAILEEGKNVKERFLTMNASLEEKYFVTTEGAKMRSRVPRLEFYGVITAYSEGKVAQRSLQYGESGGLESVERMGLLDKIKEEADVVSRLVEHAKKPPTGKLDLIVGPEVAGIMVHESVGHPQEADRIIGREAAQAGESYLSLKDLGMRIGSEEAYVSDDPTIPHSLGFYLYDEEGVRAKKRRLLYAGRLNEFLHNRYTASLLGLTSNAAARASRFDREPIIRMANTYVEPGDYKVEELFEGVKKGIYIKSFMEWNIDDKRLNQRYVGHEAYMIENGEITEMVRNPVIEITTPRLWSSLDARADDLQFSAATCGKGDPIQGVPVWSGGPHIRFREVRVGFR